MRLDQEDKLRIAVLAIDPTRRRGGGALLGDRIRMNAIEPPQVFFRSMATRGSSEVPEALDDAIAACRAAGFDLVIVETPGIGQGDAGIVEHCDLSLYVMTPEFGAASQLEKIDMLDFADAVVINKFERRGAEDALRDVRRQIARNRSCSASTPRRCRCSARSPRASTTTASPRCTSTCAAQLAERGLRVDEGRLPAVDGRTSSKVASIVPPDRTRYLAEVAETVRGPPRHHRRAGPAPPAWCSSSSPPATCSRSAARPPTTSTPRSTDAQARCRRRDPLAARRVAGPRGASSTAVPGRESQSGTLVPRVALPRYEDAGELLRFLRSENVPGRFPFTAGVFPLKREGEDPARMFAGEGDAFRTNRRFHLLDEGQPATRLSTAFDSVTLYGFDPDERPDIYGKVGNSGVSIATLDDMKVLYDGFDLFDPTTSVSMTINGPAPDDPRHVPEHGDRPAPRARAGRGAATGAGHGAGRHPQGGPGPEHLHLLHRVLPRDDGRHPGVVRRARGAQLLQRVDQRLPHRRSGREPHLASSPSRWPTASPTSRATSPAGLAIDDFAPNLSFFFSNGMDPEYAVLGRVARRIWAVAMRDRYGANERSQKLKYHVQTSGRSLHAQEMDFNDIRTTLQALIAIYDNANSLHTNAYDEAVTTPTAESVRRALAIQLIINREWGLSMNENPNQGSFVLEQLTDLVEEAVLQELERISERGGVLGAMETGYQRGRIQDESMLYEQRKHDGTLPLIGVNTFLDPNGHDERRRTPELQRSTDEEKQSQIARLRDFQARHAAERPAALERLRAAALAGDNLFAVLMDAVRVCSPRRDHPHPLRGRAAATAATSEAEFVGIDFSAWLRFQR